MKTKKRSPPDVTVTERGWPSHCIVADRCRFRRNTLVSRGRARVVVGTVGAYYVDRGDVVPDTIGTRRYYETMAFKATYDGVYWDADATKPVYFDGEWSVADWDKPDSDQRANDVHDAAVRFFVEKFRKRRQKRRVP